jgi:PAS domain S-box-containing protein
MPHPQERKIRIVAAVGVVLLATAAGAWRYRQLRDERALALVDGAPVSAQAEPSPSALATGLIVAVVLSVPLAGWFARRRFREQGEAVRNLSEAMERSRSAIMIVDLDSRIEYTNAALRAQTGYSRRELIGRRWREFQAAEFPGDMLSDLSVLARTGDSWIGQWSNRRKSGTIYPVRAIVNPVKRRDGSAACFIVEFEDLTLIKDTEAELREAKERAEAGDRAKGQFLATMSHEVRTPLNGIVGFTSLLLDMPLGPEQREYVQTIRVSAEALVNLTGDILDFARIESGKLTLDPQPCDPRECVEDALDLLAGLAAKKHLEMLHWIDDDVPSVIVADGGRLRQVLVNLVNNAVKFTPLGEIEVRVARKTVAAAGEPGAMVLRPDETGTVELEFSVRDTGVGISREKYDRLFKPFSQVDASTTRRFGGTGLGLVISKTLVEMMDGQISFRSEPDRGSTFTFSIRAPIYADGREPLEARHPARALDGWTLAIVARSAVLRNELVRLGQRWGAATLEVDFSALSAARFDLALIDVDGVLVRQLLAAPPDPERMLPQKLFGLVPLTLPTAERQELRSHFRMLVNKPMHHAALLNLLLGIPPAGRVMSSK